MVLITIVTGVYKPTYNWGAPHCAFVYIGEGIHLYMETMFFSAFFFSHMRGYSCIKGLTPAI